MRTLKMMNLHHGTLFPDPIGASRYCNDWCGSRIDEFSPAAPPPTAIEDGQPSRLPEAVHTEPAAQEATAATHGMLVAILEEHLSGTILPSRDRLLEQARLLDENFAEQAGIDWMRRPTQEAQLRLTMRRLLRMQGWSESASQDVASEILRFYRSRAGQAEAAQA